MTRFKSDGLVKSQKLPFGVIPAPLGVRDKLQPGSCFIGYLWTPAFAGVTALETFYGFIKRVIVHHFDKLDPAIEIGILHNNLKDFGQYKDAIVFYLKSQQTKK